MFSRITLAARRTWRRLVKRWAFQLIVRTRPDDAARIGKTKLELPMPVGTVKVSTTSERPSEIVFLREGFKSEADAQRAGLLLGTWLNVASALNTLSLDLGNDEARSTLGPIVRDQLEAEGLQIIPNVHGLVVVRQNGGRLARFSAEMVATVITDWSRLVTGVHEASVIPSPLDVKTAAACALVSTAEHRRPRELQLVGLVTAAEILAEQRQRGGSARTLLDKLIEEALTAREAAHDDDRGEIDALCNALRNLQSESSRSSVRRLAREASPGDPRAAATLIDRAYGARSAVVHAGKRVDDKLMSEFRPLVQAMIRLRAMPSTTSHPIGGFTEQGISELDSR